MGQLTQQFGYMKFDHHELTSDTRLSQYIRLSLDTSAETVVRFMRDGWCLTTPDLIISVTGGAKSFDMSTRLRKIFQRGLVAAAVTTSKQISYQSFEHCFLLLHRCLVNHCRHQCWCRERSGSSVE